MIDVTLEKLMVTTSPNYLFNNRTRKNTDNLDFARVKDSREEQSFAFLPKSIDSILVL